MKVPNAVDFDANGSVVILAAEILEKICLQKISVLYEGTK